MKRPSYLRQVTPRALTGAGMAALAPPRLLFRPAIVAGLIEISAPAARERMGASRPAAPRQAPPPQRATGEEASIAAPLRVPASELDPGAPRPPRAAPRATQARMEPRLPTFIVAQAPPPALSQAAVQVRPDVPGQPDVREQPVAPGLPPPPAALAASAQPLVTRGGAGATPPAPAVASQTKAATAGTPASLEQIATAAQIVSPSPVATGPAPAGAPRPAERPAETSVSQRPAKRAETLTPPPVSAPQRPAKRAQTLMPPPVSAPPRPQREPAGGGLHIGTLEVRVVAPQIVAAAVRPAARQAGRIAAPSRGQIARGFGVFGLGQS